MTIFITAIGGFLGSHLAAALSARGHQVKGSTRSSRAVGRWTTTRLALDQPFDLQVFSGCDAVVHCAHDFTPGSYTVNVRGTIAWAEAAERAGPTRQLFLSSPSAQVDAPAPYGRVKYTLERWFLERGQMVVRPGLVVGSGGLFARQRAALLRTPLVPLIGQGDQPTYVIALDHFVDAVVRMLETGAPLEASLFYDERPSMRALVTIIKRHAGQRAIIVPIPAGAAIALAHAAHRLRLPIPVTADQIRTALRPPADRWESSLPALLPGRAHEFSLARALAAAG